MPEVPIVLVVEDEEALQDIAHDALKEAGFDPVTTGSGDQALTLLESGVVKYSALVTDIRLNGDTNGWEVARQAREIDPSLAVRLYHRLRRGRLVVAGRPQQHPHSKAIRACANRDSRVAPS